MNASDPREERRVRRAWWERRTQALSVVLTLVMILFLVQLYLFQLALEEYLGDRYEFALPAFITSGVCFLFNLIFLRYVRDLGKERGR